MSLAHSKSTMTFAETEYKHGAVSQADYLRSKSRFALASADWEKAKADALAASERLRILLNLDTDKITLSVNDLTKNQYFTGDLKNPASEPWSVKMQMVQKEISEKTVSYRKASFLPTLSLIAGAQGNIKTHAIGPQNGVDRPDFHDLFTNDRINYYAGLALTWNLFNGLGTRAELDQAVAEATIAHINLDQITKQAKASRKEAVGKLEAAEKSLLASQEASEAMKLAYDQSEKDFKNGTISLTQLLEVHRDYQEALLRKYEAWSGKILAVAELRKNNGTPVWGGKP